MVQVALREQVVGMEIVGHQRKVAVVPRVHQGDELLEIFGLGPLADHDVHPQPELFPGLLPPGAFMIRADAGGDIGVEVPAGEERGVAVADAAGKGVQFIQDRIAPGKDPGVVHHLGEPQDPPFPPKGFQVCGGKRGPRGLEPGRGNAGGEQKIDIDGKTRTRLQHEPDAVIPQDVGDLVGIRHDRRRSPREDGPRQFPGASSVLSGCMWASMNPGLMNAPPASITSGES